MQTLHYVIGTREVGCIQGWCPHLICTMHMYMLALKLQAKKLQKWVASYGTHAHFHLHNVVQWGLESKSNPPLPKGKNIPLYIYTSWYLALLCYVHCTYLEISVDDVSVVEVVKGLHHTSSTESRGAIIKACSARSNKGHSLPTVLRTLHAVATAPSKQVISIPTAFRTLHTAAL